MIFSTTKEDTAAQAQLSDLGPNSPGFPLTQSRETGVLVPNPYPNDASIAKEDAAVAKPWAHFVAGA
jgi:hypothetical protein